MEPIVELATRVTTQLWLIYDRYPKTASIAAALAQDWRADIKRAALVDFSRLQGLLDLAGLWREDDWDESNPLRQFSVPPPSIGKKPGNLPERETDFWAARMEKGADAALSRIGDHIEAIRKEGLPQAIDRRGEGETEPARSLTREQLFDRVAEWMMGAGVPVLCAIAESFRGNKRQQKSKDKGDKGEDGDYPRKEFFLEEEINRLAGRLRYTPGVTADRRKAAREWLEKKPEDKLALLLTAGQLRDFCRRLGAAVPFSMVLDDELDEIARSRMVRLFGFNPGDELPEKKDLRKKTGVSSKPATHTHQAFDSCLFGLALSGGGIRSATFALGLLQGMADRNILPWVDVLSTVSGGGYIGSWLIAWIKRRGSIHSVQQSMRGYASSLRLSGWQARRPVKAALDPAQPMRAVTGNSDPRSDHVRPIRLLRDYARYLAPSDSFFGPDTWTIGAIWLRNTILNLLILLLFFGVALLVPRLPVFLWYRKRAWSGTHAFRVVLIASFPLLLACGAIWYNLRTFGPYRRKAGTTVRGNRDNGVFWFVTVPVLLGIFCESVVFWTLAHNRVSQPYQPLSWLLLNLRNLQLGSIYAEYQPFILLGGILAAGVFLICAAPQRWKGESIVGKFVGVVSTAAGISAAVSFLVYKIFWLSSVATLDPEKGGLWIMATAGPALIALIVTCVITLFMGLAGTYLSDEQREWWGRLGSWLSLAIFAWLVVTVIAFFVPLWVAKVGSQVAAWATGAGWVAVTTAGVKWAFSASSGRNGGVTEQPWFRKAILAIAPTVFALGILSAVSFGLVWLASAPLSPADNCCAAFFTKMRVNYWCMMDPADYPFTVTAVMAVLCLILAWRIDVNEFSMHNFYKNRLVRAYLGTSRDRAHRSPNAFTGFDLEDDIRLHRFQYFDPSQVRDMARDDKSSYAGPFPIINTALNITKGADLGVQERKAESFVFTPLWSGYDFSRRQGSVAKSNLAEYAFRPTEEFGEPENNGAKLGTAMAISGAAFNSNAGFHTSPALAFLLTVFGVRLGWWAGNPRKQKWTRPSPALGLGYLLCELTANTSTDRGFVLLSDGGHFENMGLYELVRRRCRFIIVSDAEEDEKFKLEGIGGAIRKCRVDFGVVIDLNLDSLRPLGDPAVSRFHYSLGTITYPDEKTCGKLIYIKASVTNDEPVDVIEFRKRHNEFPHTSTANQFFDESHFESYLALGHHTAYEVFTNDLPELPLKQGSNACDCVEKMFDRIENDWNARRQWMAQSEK